MRREALLAGCTPGDFSFFDQCFLLCPGSGAPGRCEILGAKRRSSRAGERQGRRRDAGWGAGGGTRAGERYAEGERVPRGKAAHRAGRISAGRAKRGKLLWSKEGKVILQTKKRGQEIELRKKGGRTGCCGPCETPKTIKM